MRTLFINNNIEDILKDVVKLYSNKKDDLVDSLKEKSSHIGLPNTNWLSPVSEKDTWKKYIDNFDKLKEIVL